MGKHRLLPGWHDPNGEVRFFSCSGHLYHVGKGESIGYAGRLIELGETWRTTDK